VGSSAPRECRPLATELVSVENRLDAEGIPHASLSHAPSRHRACLGRGSSVRNRRSTQSRCVRATVFFRTWLRPNLPPPRQARWEATPCGNAAPSPPSLPRWGREGSRVAGGGSGRIIRSSVPGSPAGSSRGSDRVRGAGYDGHPCPSAPRPQPMRSSMQENLTQVQQISAHKVSKATGYPKKHEKKQAHATTPAGSSFDTEIGGQGPPISARLPFPTRRSSCRFFT